MSTKKRKKTTTLRRSKPMIEVRSRISPKLAWIYPYMKKAKIKMPSLILPKQVRPFRPTREKVMRVFGNVYFDKRLIVLATHTQVTYIDKKGKLKVRKIIRMPKARILDTLAHELAHLRYPDHNYEHEEYTRMIFKTFDLKEKCPTCKGTGKIELESKP
ncbi:MAG: hypothetical protein U1F57_01060 [bacterium]